jgi:general secretion pathway protein F
MPVYEYKGLDTAGAAIGGIVDADSGRSARAKLRKDGLYPTEIWEQKAGKATRGSGLNVQVDFSRFIQRVKTAELATMTSQLSTLVGAGIPMVEALTALIDQVDNPVLKPILVQIREAVNQGDTLADAMRIHPRVFNNLYVSMVAAGEASGSLEIVLTRLTDYTESQVRLRSQVQSALIYPVLMGAVSLLIVVGLFVGVIPRIRRIFDSFGQGLPWITQVLLSISDFMVNWWFAIFLLAGFGAYSMMRWVKTEPGRRQWDAFKLRMPIFGNINRLVAVSRFCRTLSTLLDSGVPILTAVSITQTVVQNVILAEAIGAAGKNIREGESIAAPLKQSGQFPPMVTHMIAIGERTGALEALLEKIADFYDRQVKTSVEGLTSMIEPFMIGIMGFLVGGMVMAIFLPIFKMVGSMGG